MPDYLCIAWTAGSYSAALYAAPGSYGTILSFVTPPEAGTTSAASYDVALDSCTPYRRGGIPELRFSRILGALTSLPDPWMGQQCAWFHGADLAHATCYFTGDVTNYCDRYDHDLGWTRDYRALGLRNRADWIPVTDSNTLSDAIRFNMPANNLSTIMSREGRTVGQAVLDVLSGYQNQAWLGGITGISTGYGLGNYTSEGYGGSGTAVLGTTIGTNNTTVDSITVTNGGSGYTTAPTVVVAGPCNVQAVFTANVSGSAITSFTQVSAGSGYNAIPAVIISNLPSSTVNDCAGLERDRTLHTRVRGRADSLLSRIRDPNLPSQPLVVRRPDRHDPHPRPASEHDDRDHLERLRPALVAAPDDAGHERNLFRSDRPGRPQRGRLHARPEAMAGQLVHV